MFYSILFSIIILSLNLPVIFAHVTADPRPFRKEQPNGDSIPLVLHGDAKFHYLTDVEGYTVIQDKGYYVYADLKEDTGELVSTKKRVGKVNPSKIGIQQKLIPSKEVRKENCGEFCKPQLEDQEDDYQQRRRMLKNSNGILKNLVVLICFNDHEISKQPSELDYDLLFNSEGTEVIKNPKKMEIARTGSIKDVFLTSSYGKLKLESEVYPWIKVSKPESYYTNGNSGLSSRLHEAMKEALDVIDKNGFNWLDFDQDRDGKIDAITFLHSGYAAEFGGIDCHNKHESDRVWSHKWSMDKWNSRLINNHRVSVTRYHISSGKWGTCGSEITRIGVIAHETGHFLGLEDHYDGNVGLGIANYGLMGNAWGFDFSQEYPPIMSPWNKIQMGWLDPIVISESKKYEIAFSADNPVVYKIEEGYPDGEYLLIENRQPKSHDKKMPQGGILIWHIDELAEIETEGFPDQMGWPHNGKHYKVALLQADGNYDLERGNDYGDSSDAFHADGIHSIGPSGISNGKAFPNTNSYQGGNIYSTDIIISEISKSGDVMSFRLSKQSESTTELATSFQGGNGQAGVMFDVIPQADIIIHSIDIHTSSTDPVNVEIWTREGSWEGFDKNSHGWIQRGKVKVRGQGSGVKTPVNGFDGIRMEKGKTYGMYITLDENYMIYSNAKQQESVAASNQNLSITVGVGKKYPFSTTIPKRVWNGSLRYLLL